MQTAVMRMKKEKHGTKAVRRIGPANAMTDHFCAVNDDILL